MMSKNKIKVIIADDHNLYRAGLKALLEDCEKIQLLAEASNGEDVIQLTKQFKPDVVVTDLIMSGIDGVDAIREISAATKARVLALSTFDSEHLITKALEAGAKGYVVKNAQDGEIIEAIKKLYNFRPYYCSSTQLRLARMIGKSQFNPYTNTIKERFSDKEKKVIHLICEERSSEEIGQILHMSKRTVDGMRMRIMRKMDVKTTAGLTIYAIKNFLFFLDKPEE